MAVFIHVSMVDKIERQSRILDHWCPHVMRRECYYIKIRFFLYGPVWLHRIASLNDGIPRFSVQFFRWDQWSGLIIRSWYLEGIGNILAWVGISPKWEFIAGLLSFFRKFFIVLIMVVIFSCGILYWNPNVYLLMKRILGGYMKGICYKNQVENLKL